MLAILRSSQAIFAAIMLKDQWGMQRDGFTRCKSQPIHNKDLKWLVPFALQEGDSSVNSIGTASLQQQLLNFLCLYLGRCLERVPLYHDTLAMTIS